MYCVAEISTEIMHSNIFHDRLSSSGLQGLKPIPADIGHEARYNLDMAQAVIHAHIYGKFRVTGFNASAPERTTPAGALLRGTFLLCVMTTTELQPLLYNTTCALTVTVAFFGD